ncbi:type I toxin-antitoxin system toxin Ldr family protein [Escherichia coli]|nr:type I toxin-antitoxin system toxin Ldr family protein [Escherichia coli]MCZ5543519.1 type I toxin-antitoxin system toxin Ldr family protein [Escherichia coli]MCZ5543522.1 type I toxin-antitoxin system toxin Ldr family protein [Escherichia coli]
MAEQAEVWHDLAAPVIAGILASMIVNWLNKRK